MSCSTVVALLVLAHTVSATLLKSKQKSVLNAIKKIQASDHSGLVRRLDGHDEAMASCFEACPKLEKAASSDDEGEALCADVDGTIGCLLNEEGCEDLKEMLLEGMSEEQAMQSTDLDCKALELKCDKKAEDMMKDDKCGPAMEDWIKEGCSEAAQAGTLADKESTCCPFVETVFTCYPVECLNIATAKAKLENDEEEMKENLEIAKTCTEIKGLVTSASEVDNVVSSGGESTSAEGEAGTTGFAAPAQATPVVAVAAMVLAVFA